MAGIGTLSGIALECRDPAALAEFYRLLTGWPVVYTTPEWYSIGADDDLHLSSQLAHDHQPPTWPDPPRPCSSICTSGWTTWTWPSGLCSQSGRRRGSTSPIPTTYG